MLHHSSQQYAVSPLDLSLLSMLTADNLPSSSALPQPRPAHRNNTKYTDRRPPVDPLMVAAASSAGPDVTRNHYLHEFFPQKLAYASCDDERAAVSSSPPKVRMQSQQAPRRIRLATEAEEQRKKELEQTQHDIPVVPLVADLPAPPPAPSSATVEPLAPVPSAVPTSPPPTTSSLRRLSVSDPTIVKQLLHHPVSSPPPPSAATVLPAPSPLASASVAPSVPTPLPPLVVRCEVRTRIPTPHGHIFLHLYSNNHDNKEHLAFVADQAQMDALSPETDTGAPNVPFIRSDSLDKERREGETEMERIVRGAYVGRLSATSINPSSPHPRASTVDPLASSSSSSAIEPPLVRIHSECFTGEVIGSQRCDCGEQLDEAFRLVTTTGRGIVVYLRQEGRGIGLLEKMRAYNLQDLGHDTVTANLMLGHGADMRTYDIAGAILRDLAVPEVRLLTNNPDKIEQIEKEGVKVVERVAMVPRSWIPERRKRGRKAKGTDARPRMSGSALLQLANQTMVDSLVASSEEDFHSSDEDDEDEDDYSDGEDESYPSSSDSDASHNLRRSGIGMIGASTTRSPELEKYLRTKIERMGHMLDLPTPPSTTSTRPPSVRSASSSSSISGRKQKTNGQTGKRRTSGEPHPLSSSVVSMEASGRV